MTKSLCTNAASTVSFLIYFHAFHQHFGRVQQREGETQKGHIPWVFGLDFNINPIFLCHSCVLLRV